MQVTTHSQQYRLNLKNFPRQAGSIAGILIRKRRIQLFTAMVVTAIVSVYVWDASTTSAHRTQSGHLVSTAKPQVQSMHTTTKQDADESNTDDVNRGSDNKTAPSNISADTNVSSGGSTTSVKSQVSTETSTVHGSHTSVTIDGQSVTVPEDGTVSKHMRSDDSNSSVNISVSGDESSNNNSTSTTDVHISDTSNSSTSGSSP